MEQSAKIQRDPPEIHRSDFLSNISLNSCSIVVYACYVYVVCVCLCPGLAWFLVEAVHPSLTALV